MPKVPICIAASELKRSFVESSIRVCQAKMRECVHRCEGYEGGERERDKCSDAAGLGTVEVLRMKGPREDVPSSHGREIPSHQSGLAIRSWRE